MPRRALSSPATLGDSPADRLQAAVEELADNVRVLTDVVDQIREDLSWLTRNGVPHQPLTVLVHRMPLRSGDGPKDGTFDFSLLSLPVRDPTAETLSDEELRTAAIDRIVERLADPLGQLAQEQLNLLLSMLDHAHRELLQAIRTPQAVQPEDPKPPKPVRRRTKKAAPPPSDADPPPDPPPPLGRLF